MVEGGGVVGREEVWWRGGRKCGGGEGGSVVEGGGVVGREEVWWKGGGSVVRGGKCGGGSVVGREEVRWRGAVWLRGEVWCRGEVRLKQKWEGRGIWLLKLNCASLPLLLISFFPHLFLPTCTLYLPPSSPPLPLSSVIFSLHTPSPRLRQQQLEMEKAEQLRRPTEDLLVHGIPSITVLPSLAWVRLPASSFADLLMAVEFGNSFDEFLELDPSPSLCELYLSLYNEQEGEVLVAFCMQLLRAVLYDPGECGTCMCMCIVCVCVCVYVCVIVTVYMYVCVCVCSLVPRPHSDFSYNGAWGRG